MRLSSRLFLNFSNEPQSKHSWLWLRTKVIFSYRGSFAPRKNSRQLKAVASKNRTFYTLLFEGKNQAELYACQENLSSRFLLLPSICIKLSFATHNCHSHKSKDNNTMYFASFLSALKR